jgi:tetratricopeptide (TPR) repeat protein
MTTKKQGLSQTTRGSERSRAMVIAAIVVGSMICTIWLARWIDSRRPAPNLQLEEERLYLAGHTLRRASLSFNGLAADWYWMRSLQYVGLKLLKSETKIPLDDLSLLNLKLLAPLLDATTTLDPEFREPYEYAAVVLPAVDVQQAISITKKGIAANPSAWRLYQHLGYIYWQQGNFQAASEAYGRGALLSGAPPWMEAMKARMVSESGSRDLAREIYRRMYEQAEENEVKKMAWLRLLQLDSFDQRDALRKVISLYQTRVGRCPSSWKELEPVFRASRLRVDAAGAPLDPSGAAYVLVSGKCEVELDPRSEVPRK